MNDNSSRFGKYIQLMFHKGQGMYTLSATYTIGQKLRAKKYIN